MMSFIDDAINGAKALIKMGSFGDDIAKGFRYARAPRQAAVAAQKVADSIVDMDLTEDTVRSLYKRFNDRWGVDATKALSEPNVLRQDAIDFAKANRGELENSTQYLGAGLGKLRNYAGQTFSNPWMNMAAFEFALPMGIYSAIDMMSAPEQIQQLDDIAMQQQMLMGQIPPENFATRDAISDAPQLQVPTINGNFY